MNMLKRYIVLITLIIISVSFTVANKMIILPKKGEIIRLQNDIKKEKQRVNILKDIHKLREKVEYYSELVGKEKKLAWLLKELFKTAERTGIKLDTLSPESPQTRDIYIRLPVKIETECNFHDMGDFISWLESSPRYVSIDSFDIQSSQNEQIRTRYRKKSISNSETKSKVRMIVSTIALRE